MSGHSKWAKLKHSKPTADAKKSKNFSKYSNIIAQAAKQGGNADPKLNPHLKDALDKARQINLPQENIDRAIKRGLGLIPGVVFEELVIEAYGPEGVALLIQAATDNKNRCLPEIKKILADNDSSLAGAGSVFWLFQEISRFTVEKKSWPQNQEFELEAIAAGAEEIIAEENLIAVLCNRNGSEKLKQFLREKSIVFEVNQEYLPQNEIKLTDEKTSEKISNLIETLEARDDVNAVYTNAELSSNQIP